jgi:hypothetical protein
MCILLIFFSCTINYINKTSIGWNARDCVLLTDGGAGFQWII